MQLTKLLTVFLLYSSTIYAMELTITNSFNSIPLNDDLFSVVICSQLDRIERANLRCSCKKYLNLVLSQDGLNKSYKEAFDKKDDLKMIHFKNLGGLFSYQEIAYAVKNKKDKLATWLLEKNEDQIVAIYYGNIQEAITTSAVDEVLPVIKWLLHTRQPETYFPEYFDNWLFIKVITKQYPDAQKIMDVFCQYTQDRNVLALLSCRFLGNGL